MTNREIIQELERQKSLLGTSFFDERLLEKYLNLSATKREGTMEIAVHGIGSLEKLNHKLTKMYPFEYAKPRFNRIKGAWPNLIAIAKKTDLPVNITIESDNELETKTSFVLKYEK